METEALPLQIACNPELLQVAKRAVTKHLIEAVPRTTTPPRPGVSAPRVVVSVKKPNQVRVPTKIDALPKRDSTPRIKPEAPEKANLEMTRMVAGVHFDIYEYFNLSPSTIGDLDLKRLQSINNWLWDGAAKLPDALRRLHNLDIKLGRNVTGESHLAKLYNHIKLRSLRGKS